MKLKEYFDKHKKLIRSLSIIITILGWLIANSNHYSFVYTVLAPRYIKAMYAYNKIQQNGCILEKGITGFNEISELIEKDTAREYNNHISILKIETLSQGAQVGINGININPIIIIRVTSALNGTTYITSTDLSLLSLKSELEDAYLTSNIWFYGKAIFWIGIVFSFISIII